MSEQTPLKEKVPESPTKTPVAIHQIPQKDYSKVMKAVVWHGKENIKVETVPRPAITDPGDAIIRVHATTICGSDLHLYHNAIPEMKKGDILGHEAMGIVEEVGPDVKEIKKGDRVVVSCAIACGSCEFCQKQQFSCCDRTNPSKTMEKMFGGHRIAGFFGYSHLTGGYPGGQAEYLRVPFADVNLLKLPNEISDEEAVLLSDVVCTGWHCCELGEVTEGKTVACWGLGPIGLMTLVWARHRKAARCIGIDAIPERLEMAKRLGFEVINYKQDDPVKTLLKMIPNGPDCALECVGFRYAKSWRHTFEKALSLETDSIDSLTECIFAVKKGGNVAIIGDFIGYANHFPIGPVMEKGLTLRGGQVFVQKYWKDLCSKISNKEVDVAWLISHRMNLDEAAEAYRMFDKKEKGVLKIILKPNHSGFPS